MRAIARLFLLLCTVSAALSAQTVTPNLVTPYTNTGLQPFGTYDGVRENIALSNGNLNLQVPLLKLPQRAGRTWDLGLEFDSKSYQLHAFLGGSNTVVMAWKQDDRLPMIAPNLRLSVPTLQSTVNVVISQNGFNDTCVNSWIFTSSDGSKHTFSNSEECQGSVPCGCMSSIHISDSSDASFVRLDTTNLADIVVYLKDGTQVHFYNYIHYAGYVGVFGKIIDTNGNIISATHTGNISTGVYTFTDSVGRNITADLTNHTIGFKDANGSSQSIVFANANVNTGGPITFVHPNHECSMPGSPGTMVLSGSQSVGTTDSEWAMTVPDGAAGLIYRFHYNAAAEPTKVTYPSGGYTKYDYAAYVGLWNPGGGGGGVRCTADFREVTAKHECRNASGSCATEDTTTYTATLPTDPNSNASNQYMDVRSPDPSGTTNRTRYSFSTDFAPFYAPRETDRTIYSGESTQLRAIHTDYVPNNIYCTQPMDASIPSRVTTTLTDISPNLTSKVETDFDTITLTSPPSGWCGTLPFPIDNPTEVREFGYDGALKRRTDSTWLKSGSYVIDQLHILDRKLTDTVYDASTNTCNGVAGACAQSTYEYENYTQGLSSSGATQHQAMTNYRGNLTAISRWLNPGGTWLLTRFQYDDGGNITKATDPRGNSTNYSFADNFSQTSCTPGANGLTGNAAAYVKTITNALNQVSTYSYNSCFGNLATATDPNLQATTYVYDTLGRKASVSFPDSGLTSWTYNDAAPISITQNKKQTATANVATVEVHDGLGRVLQTKLTSDPAGTDYVDTTYDVAGRRASVSNPYRTTSDPTYGITSYQYDALNRPTTITRQDGGTVLTSYAGAASQVQDEGNGTSRVTRVSQTDAQGRLISICEVSGVTLLGSGATPAACGQNIAATGFLTTYQYDALNNLTSVTQSGLNARTFVYDSLSRLTSATNPESGATSYAYDSNGNLTTKTDARGITVNYSPTGSPIDALNRVTQKTYSDGTPTATFTYDVSSADGLTGLQKTVGRLVESSVGTARTVNSYDPMGRVLNQWQCTPQNCGTAWFSLAYQYDYLGNPTSSTNGKGVTLTYGYNASAQLTGVTSSLSDANHPAALFSSGVYNPTGALTGASLGNGIGLTRAYNPRTRLTSVSDGSAYTLGLTYAPDGDLLTGNDSVNGNWTYGYDDFNRLKSASATGQSYTYDYDRFGNRWHQNGPYTMLESFSGNNNRMDGYSYDAAGNLLNDGTHSYSYDAENRIKQVDSGSTATYVYDGSGLRVRKTTAASVDFLYDLAGREITEVSSSGGWNRGEVYAAGRHVATYASGTTYFIHGDHLGTERKRTNVSAGSIETCTSLAFGDHLTCSGTDVSPMHFTGKEHDAESNLENFGARYDSASLGRFMTPDPLYLELHRLGDPQQLNLYSYTRNNPLKFTDPLGLDIFCSGQRCEDYIKALQASLSFKVSLSKEGKVVTEGDIDKKGLSKAEEALLGAITDEKNHVHVDAIDGAKDTSITTFAKTDGNGTHTIAFGQVSLLDRPKNAGGLTSTQLVGHETLEGYSEAKGSAFADAHSYANQFFPGLTPLPGGSARVQGGVVTDATFEFSVQNTSIIERITEHFVTPIPKDDFLKGRGAPYPGYPTDVEKKP